MPLSINVAKPVIADCDLLTGYAMCTCLLFIMITLDSAGHFVPNTGEWSVNIWFVLATHDLLELVVIHSKDRNGNTKLML